PDLAVVRLQPEIPYAFTPGQYCTIGLDGVERPYSIVSSPHEPFLELFLELVQHGELTPKLWTLRVGDAVSLRPRPKGVFTLEEKFPVHLMVATVTGIAPFVSILRHAIHRRARRVRLVVPQGAAMTGAVPGPLRRRGFLVKEEKSGKEWPARSASGLPPRSRARSRGWASPPPAGSRCGRRGRGRGPACRARRPRRPGRPGP